jgi:hypothetical protein
LEIIHGKSAISVDILKVSRVSDFGDSVSHKLILKYGNLDAGNFKSIHQCLG